jgi:putative transposase
MGFIETMRGQGHAVESVCRVLREQGCQVAARTYRAWRSRRVPAAWTVSDAHVMNAILAASFDERGGLAPEGLYGRRKMTGHLRRTGYPGVAHCTVDRRMKALGRNGIRRGRAIRTTVQGKDGRRGPGTC